MGRMKERWVQRHSKADAATHAVRIDGNSVRLFVHAGEWQIVRGWWSEQCEGCGADMLDAMELSSADDALKCQCGSAYPLHPLELR